MSIEGEKLINKYRDSFDIQIENKFKVGIKEISHISLHKKVPGHTKENAAIHHRKYGRFIVT